MNSVQSQNHKTKVMDQILKPLLPAITTKFKRIMVQNVTPNKANVKSLLGITYCTVTCRPHICIY